MKEIARKLALGLAVHCVRNTRLENLHAGISPQKDGIPVDGIIVQSGDQNIAQSQVSKISDAEMKELMVEVVQNLYGFAAA